MGNAELCKGYVFLCIPQNATLFNHSNIMNKSKAMIMLSMGIKIVQKYQIAEPTLD